MSDQTISVEQQTAALTNGPTLEELQKGYQLYVERKQKQCQYQKKYIEKKKSEFAQLQIQIEQLQIQNQNLLVYYNLVQILRQQHPQLYEQLIKQQTMIHTIPQQNTPGIELPHLQRLTLTSPNLPFVSLKQENQ